MKADLGNGFSDGFLVDNVGERLAGLIASGIPSNVVSGDLTVYTAVAVWGGGGMEPKRRAIGSSGMKRSEVVGDRSESSAGVGVEVVVGNLGHWRRLTG